MVYTASMLTPEQLSVFNTLRDQVAENAEKKQFRAKMYEGLTPEQIAGPVGDRMRAAIYTANQHGEASEFWEAYRKGTLDKPCDKADEMVALGLPALTCAEEEIADEIIRACDKAQAHGVDVAKAVSVKMEFNSHRPVLHGGKQA